MTPVAVSDNGGRTSGGIVCLWSISVFRIYQQEVTISGPGGSAVVHDTSDLVGAARSLGFREAGSFPRPEVLHGDGIYSGTLDYGYEDGTLVYSVTVN